MRHLLGGVRNIQLHDPFGHHEMLQAMRDSDLILSDSGGMQEEAPVLGVPLLILRDRTERPEGIASGNLKLVGRDPDSDQELGRLAAGRRGRAAIDEQALPALRRRPRLGSHRRHHRALAQAGRTSIAIVPVGDRTSRAVEAVRFPKVAA